MGRLDSTNVCSQPVSVITSISLDHTQQMGGTLAAIAREKAGIIKSRTPIVSGVDSGAARDVIREIAGERQSELLELKRDFDFQYRPPRSLNASSATGQVDYFPLVANAGAAYRNIDLTLVGHHQAANAATAIATLARLDCADWSIPQSALRSGLATARCPATCAPCAVTARCAKSAKPFRKPCSARSTAR